MDGLQSVNLSGALNKRIPDVTQSEVKWDNTSLVLDIFFKILLFLLLERKRERIPSRCCIWWRAQCGA